MYKRQVLEIFTEKDKYDATAKYFESEKYIIAESNLVKKAKETIEYDDKTSQKIAKLTDELEENEDVQSVWTNSSI